MSDTAPTHSVVTLRRGFALIGGFAVLLSAFLAFKPDWIRPYTPFSVELDHSFGIREGIPVTVSGREIGYVKMIELTEDRVVRMHLAVDSRYRHHIHRD
ncbi:MAG: MlaD family protein, partial [Myxococcota bacterium]